MRTPDEPVAPDALLVMGLWRDPAGAWRVRVSRSTRPDHDRPSVSYAATRPAVLRAVEEWLDQAVTPS